MKLPQGNLAERASPKEDVGEEATRVAASETDDTDEHEDEDEDTDADADDEDEDADAGDEDGEDDEEYEEEGRPSKKRKRGDGMQQHRFIRYKDALSCSVEEALRRSYSY